MIWVIEEGGKGEIERVCKSRSRGYISGVGGTCYEGGTRRVRYM